MSSGYVAFLRGINLGKRRVKNEALCACFEELGLEEVSGFLASGNILFQTKGARAAQLETAIGAKLEETLGYEVTTFVRTAKQVAAVGSLQPFSAKVLSGFEGKLQVAFLGIKPSAALVAKALAFSTEDDLLAIDGKELYWQPKGKLSMSKLNLNAITKVLGTMTVRNQSTVARIAKKL